MLNETHRTPPRYKIPDFFSSLLEEYRQQLADAKTDLAAYAQDDYSPGDYAQRFIPLKLQLDLIITITSEPIGVSELLFSFSSTIEAGLAVRGSNRSACRAAQPVHSLSFACSVESVA